MIATRDEQEVLGYAEVIGTGQASWKGQSMKVSVTELKTGIEQYLELVGREEIVITKDGQDVAQLAPPPKNKQEILESLYGILPPSATLEEARAERLAKYEAGL